MIDHSILSPSGHASKVARKAAMDRLSKELWPNGCTKEDITGTYKQPGEREKLIAHIAMLENMGGPKEFKEAAKLRNKLK